MMKKLLFFLVIIVSAPFFSFAKAQSGLNTINLSTNVATSLAISIDSTGYGFGDLVANIPEKGSAGVGFGVVTNSPNGDALSAHDGIPGSGSALLHTDLTTRIVDFYGSVVDPQPWIDGKSRGLGVTVFSADTSKEAKWGTGTTYNDTNNKYVGVPEFASTIHVSTGYKTGNDTTDIAFAVDVDSDQKPGVYSGPVTITVVAVLP
jgi:hypothetical protein